MALTALLHEMVAGDRTALQAVLKHASPGRQQPLWAALPHLAPRVLFIAGGEDAKFVALAHSMAAAANSGDVSTAGRMAVMTNQETQPAAASRSAATFQRTL